MSKWPPQRRSEPARRGACVREVACEDRAVLEGMRERGWGRIVHAVSFFASEAASFVTGQRLLVDGGRSVP
jgi:NAD(P)-dependent dehydrogenase (short-subunit alcohol dehydrogenase family)